MVGESDELVDHGCYIISTEWASFSAPNPTIDYLFTVHGGLQSLWLLSLNKSLVETGCWLLGELTKMSALNKSCRSPGMDNTCAGCLAYR